MGKTDPAFACNKILQINPGLREGNHPPPRSSDKEKRLPSRLKETHEITGLNKNLQMQWVVP